jgi:hypothetical protein
VPRLLLVLTEPEMPMPLPSRRSFLQAAITAVASLSFPWSLRAGGNPRSSWFLNAPTGESWQVDHPVAWCLANTSRPVLERASEGLWGLTPADDSRIMRLVTRRCRLNLIEVRATKVVVHFWGRQGRGDLRPFFERHGLARHHVGLRLLLGCHSTKKQIRTPQPALLKPGTLFPSPIRLAERQN